MVKESVGRTSADAAAQDAGRRVNAIVSSPSARLMRPAERTYRVPCACSHGVIVTAGQAGGRVSCPACGAEVVVPRLRDLAALVVVEEAAAPRAPVWDAGRGLLVAGGALALVAAVLAASLNRMGGFFFPLPPGEAAIRMAVDQAPEEVVQSMWESASRGGVARPITADELRLIQFTRLADGVSKALWGVAAVGVAMAGIGAWRCLASSDRASGPLA